MDAAHQPGTRVPIPGLGPRAREGQELAGHVDRATGTLIPARTGWRTRPITLSRRAEVFLVGNGRRVDLVLERFNGWRKAAVPLLLVHKGEQDGQAPDVLLALADEIDRHRPRDPQRAGTLLRAQAQHLQKGGTLRSSPLIGHVIRGGGGAISALGQF